MRRYAVLAGALALSILSAWPVRAGDWKLVWSDEFDEPGLPNPAKWSYEEGLVRNHEAQYYTKGRLENARVEGGMLVIEARREAFADADGQHPAAYTSASLNTKGKASWTYGRIEARAKLPPAKGVWAAIWALGDNISEVGWPKCGEIDLMEFVGNEPAEVHGTIHYSKDGKHAASGGSAPIVNPGDGFHIYATEWTPDRIDFFFDGYKYHTFPLEVAGAGPDNPFHQPQYLILNLALGGSWGGKIDDAALPQKFLIDYVRVYEPAK